MWSCDQSWVTLAFLWGKLSWPQFYRDFTRENNFLRSGLRLKLIIWACTRCAIEILHQCGKRVKTKSQSILGANSYVCRSYREKLVVGVFFRPLPPPSVLSSFKSKFVSLYEIIKILDLDQKSFTMSTFWGQLFFWYRSHSELMR